MKINEEIKSLNLKPSLLVVMGTHHGIIYNLDSDSVTKVDEHRVDTPVYSDNEGMFQRGGPDSSSTGSVLEPKKEQAQEDFSKEFAGKLEDISQKESIKSIYLFAPLESKGLIDSDWSDKTKEIIEESFDGNFTPENPTELIDMIVERHNEKNKKEPFGEAKDILEKTDHIK